MLRHCNGELRHRLGMGIAGVISFLALLYVGSGGTHIWRGPPDGTALPSLGDGVVGGVFVAGAACAAIVAWRRQAQPVTRWILATGALIACQSLLVTLLALRSEPPRSALVLGVLITVAVAGLVGVVGPLLVLQRVTHLIDDGFAIGLGMGLMAASHLLLQFPMVRPAPVPLQVLIGVLVATHVAVTVLVLRQGVLSRPVAWLVVATTMVVGVAQVVNAVDLGGTLWDVPVSLARDAIGAAWISFAWITLHRALEEDRRRINTFEHALVSTTRDQRERLHELRSTVAGLVSGSAMLDRPDMPSETRQHLWGSVRRELDRMERLLSGQDDPATDIDLDEALGLIIDLQRLKGRRVELRSSGDDVVRARFDALAEVVNILMDNAEKHGGTDSSVVEVVRRDEETVDITVTDFGRGIAPEQRPRIFEWGGRGRDSAGEGIGLHVAQRLVTEDGGSLQLAQDQGVGSSFVITLPAARRPFEDDSTLEDGHAWPRSG